MEVQPNDRFFVDRGPADHLLKSTSFSLLSRGIVLCSLLGITKSLVGLQNLPKLLVREHLILLASFQVWMPLKHLRVVIRIVTAAL